MYREEMYVQLSEYVRESPASSGKAQSTQRQSNVICPAHFHACMHEEYFSTHRAICTAHPPGPTSSAFTLHAVLCRPQYGPCLEGFYFIFISFFLYFLLQSFSSLPFMIIAYHPVMPNLFDSNSMEQRRYFYDENHGYIIMVNFFDRLDLFQRRTPSSYR